MNAAQLIQQIQQVNPAELRQELEMRTKRRDEVIANYDREIALIVRMIVLIEGPQTTAGRPVVQYESDPAFPDYGPVIGTAAPSSFHFRSGEFHPGQPPAAQTPITEAPQPGPTSESSEPPSIEPEPAQAATEPPTVSETTTEPEPEPVQTIEPPPEPVQAPEPVKARKPATVRPAARQTKPAVVMTPSTVATYLNVMGRCACGSLARYFQVERETMEDLLETDPQFKQDQNGFWNLRSKVEEAEAKAHRF